MGGLPGWWVRRRTPLRLLKRSLLHLACCASHLDTEGKALNVYMWTVSPPSEVRHFRSSADWKKWGGGREKIFLHVNKTCWNQPEGPKAQGFNKPCSFTIWGVGPLGHSESLLLFLACSAPPPQSSQTNQLTQIQPECFFIIESAAFTASFMRNPLDRTVPLSPSRAVPTVPQTASGMPASAAWVAGDRTQLRRPTFC